MVPQNESKNGWVGGAIAVGVALAVGAGLLGSPVHQMTPRGNQSDTGIMEEVRAMQDAGVANNICDALAILMREAESAGDNQRKQRIKATQKANKCRRSRRL